ncbi:hypothetical protein IFR04_005300 [Cadophora malorum]|uniref:Hydrophobin n=1 Tax=Cadophora malorum TaxID=108018 RepID=A0A8H7WB88_9HELO|nr:hypothetical protein IFR04_005300 [Cadophora malorum]
MLANYLIFILAALASIATALPFPDGTDPAAASASPDPQAGGTQETATFGHKKPLPIPLPIPFPVPVPAPVPAPAPVPVPVPVPAPAPAPVPAPVPVPVPAPAPVKGTCQCTVVFADKSTQLLNNVLVGSTVGATGQNASGAACSAQLSVGPGCGVGVVDQSVDGCTVSQACTPQ